MTGSNGLGWSPDGGTLYYIDSGTWRVDACAFDAAAGGATGRRPAIPFPKTLGVPDGLAMDVEGMVWVALMNGGAADGLVLRCDPATRNVIGRVHVPGGRGGRRLRLSTFPTLDERPAVIAAAFAPTTKIRVKR